MNSRSGVLVPGCPGGVRLVSEYEPSHGIDVLSRYAVVVHPFALAVELHERESPELRFQDIPYEPAEPGRSYLSVYLLVGLPVPSELDGCGEHCVFPFFDDACQVGVHEYVAVEVIQSEPPGIVHVLEGAYGQHIVRYVYSEAPGLCQYDGRGSFLPGPRQIPAGGYLSGPFLSFTHVTSGLHVYGCF